MRGIYRFLLSFALLNFSAAFGNANSKLTENQSEDPVNSLLALYRLEKDPEQQVRIALTLAELSLKESPNTSLQFLSLIESKIGFNRQITPFIQYFKARAYAASGQYTIALEHLTLTNEFLVPTDLHKKVMELQLDSFAKLNQRDRFVELYEIYNRRYPLYMQLESLRKDAAQLFLERNNQARHLQLVESLAEKYPLTETSRWALKTLDVYTCQNNEKSAVQNYHFPQSLLQRINWQSALDPGLENWIESQIGRPLKTHDHKTKILTEKEQIEWLLKLKKFDLALHKITKETLLNRIPKADEADYEVFKGQAYQGLGDLRRALSIYQTTLSHQPTYWKAPSVRERMAYIYARLGYAALAAETFGELQRRSGKDRYRWLQFWYTYRANDHTEALSYLQNITISSHPDRDSIAIKYWRARALEKTGKKQEAEQIFQQIVTDSPHSFYSVMAVNKDKSLDRYLNIIPKIASGNIEDQTSVNAPEPNFEPESEEDNSIETSAAASASDSATLIKTESLDKKLDTIKYSLTGVSGLHDWIMGLQSLASRGGIKGSANQGFKGLAESWNNSDFPLAYFDIVTTESKKHKLDPYLLLSIIRAESRYRKDALSPVGALGLMQIMPFTAMRIAEDLGDGKFQLNSLLDPQENIRYGAFYFGKLLHFYGDNVAVALAAYNAGPSAVTNWLESCRNCELDEFVDGITYRETRNYVKKIIGYYSNYKRQHSSLQVLALKQPLPINFDRNINIY